MRERSIKKINKEEEAGYTVRRKKGEYGSGKAEYNKMKQQSRKGRYSSFLPIREQTGLRQMND